MLRVDPPRPLVPDDFGWAYDLWTRSRTGDPLTPELFRERMTRIPAGQELFGLVSLGAGLAPDGFAMATYPSHWGPRIGGLRMLATAPDSDPAAGMDLLAQVEARMRTLGAEELVYGATPPYYVRPGIDPRETGLISRLLDAGWRHEQTAFNMTVDLLAWQDPGEQAIGAPDSSGCRVRRAVGADAGRLAEFVERHFTSGWRDESALGFSHQPVSIFLAERGAEILGFAAYEVSQCLGSFGPTGVAPDARGGSIGKRLLWACLSDLRRLGRPRCEIGWVGPVPFYHRSCGAILGPAYWIMRKHLAQETPR